MFRIFRKLKWSLLEDRRIRKYLLYSVGEILLVIIGILIALQVNNWNDGRKLRNEAEALLLNLENDLQQDSTVLAQQYSVEHSIMLPSSQYLYELHLRGQVSPDMDSLTQVAFRYATFTPPSVLRVIHSTG